MVCTYVRLLAQSQRPYRALRCRYRLPSPLCRCLYAARACYRCCLSTAGAVQVPDEAGAFARGCVMVASAAPPAARRPQAASCVPARAAIAAIAAPHALARQGPWRCSTPRHGACRAGAARRSSAYRPGCVGARCMPVACVLPARCTHAARRCLLVYYARASMLLRVYAQY